MTNIILSPETVAVAKEILESGFDGRVLPFKDCFEKSETVLAKHLLFEQYRDAARCPIPKVFVYIVMDEIFGPCTGYDDVSTPGRRDAGYYLKLKENIKPDAEGKQV